MDLCTRFGLLCWLVDRLWLLLPFIFLGLFDARHPFQMPPGTGGVKGMRTTRHSLGSVHKPNIGFVRTSLHACVLSSRIACWL